MRIATWNVNSLKVRLGRVEEWLAYARPDVVCMQETKLADAAFPHLAFEALGYETVHHGEGRWNGVAIASRVGLDDLTYGFAEGIDADTDARIVTARCGGIVCTSVYVPNGRSVGSDHYAYKLDWLARLRRHLPAVAGGGPAAVCGDFNIAPEDRDVWDPKAFLGSTHVTDEERSALRSLVDDGMVDAFRRCWPDEDELYTYWDYRAGDFHQHRGMRIDLVLVSDALAERVRWAVVDRNARKGKQPSDHAPLIVDLAD
jgi:exodeoxyribonuclease-3